MQAVDIGLRNRDNFSQLTRRPHDRRIVLGHHRRFHRRFRIIADGEYPVIAQQRCRTPMPGQFINHQLANVFAADQGRNRSRGFPPRIRPPSPSSHMG